MATFVFYAEALHTRRPDGRNTFVASGANEAEARAAAEALIAQPGSLAEFRAVQLDDNVPGFVVEGSVPLGVQDQIMWPKQGRSGDFLPGA